MRLLPLLLLLCSGILMAQGIGLHPPQVDWQQLRGDNVRVLFPAGYESRAQRVASLIDWMAENATRSVGDRLYDFDLVLQTPNITVNGYVGLAPFRSEFFVTPPQSFNLLSSADWVDLLTIHEFRHVQQFSNSRRGITKLASFVQGQLGWAGFTALSVPNWFLEGDAVVTETALTESGRGRTPAFSSDLRALLRYRGDVYRYAKARNGSYKDLVPDHYRYGYGMLTFARERFGNDVWKQVLHHGAAYRHIIYPFSRALKRATGYNTKRLYLATTADLQVKQDSMLIVDPATVPGELLSYSDNDVRDYRFPFVDGRGRLLAYRSSYRFLPAIVAVNPGGKDQIITPVGIQREPWIDGGKQRIVWTEYRQDPRYTNESYSELVVYELGSGEKQVITDKGHYLSASLSHDEQQLAAVWYEPTDDGPQLHLLDLDRRVVIQRRTFDALAIAWPRFAPDGRTVYYLAKTPEGVAIRAYDLTEDAVSTLRPATHEPIDMLEVTEEGLLLFTNGRSGIDNVYRLDPATGEESQLTDVPIGAYYPYQGGQTLYFSTPTTRGERLSRLNLDNPDVERLTVDTLRPSVFERPAAYAAERFDLPTNIEVKDYPTKNFSNTLGGLKFHSWSFNGTFVTPGVSARISNALNTASIDFTGFYNINEDRYAGGAALTYGGLYGVVSLTGLYGDRNTTIQENRTDSLRLLGQEFSQLSIGPTVTVPLQWVSGNRFTSFLPFLGYQYIETRDPEGESPLPPDFSNLTTGFAASSLRRTALRQVQSRLGVIAGLSYDRGLGSDASAERLQVQSSTFLPSPFPTHGFRIDADYMRERAKNLYQYTDNFTYARGYVQPLADWVYRLGVNYQLPLGYPDIGGNFVFLKRIRLLGFFDYSRLAIQDFPNARFTERSTGVELYFDASWFNTAELQIGMQISYLLDDDLFSADENDLQTRLLLSGRF